MAALNGVPYAGPFNSRSTLANDARFASPALLVRSLGHAKLAFSPLSSLAWLSLNPLDAHACPSRRSIMNIVRIGLFAPLFFLAGISTARADVPPPDDYVEQCTVALKEQPGTTCEACQNSYESFQGNDPCKTKYAGTNFTKACKSWGASVWTEVWCDGPPRPDSADSDSGCSCTHVGIGKSAPVTVPVGLALVALAFARRSRRNRS